MKAVDYYNRDHLEVFSSPDMNAGRNIAMKLAKEFMEEAKQLVASRGAQTNRAIIAIMKEQNQKWNAMVRLYKKHYNKSPILKDGFMRFWQILVDKEIEKQQEEKGEKR